MAWKNWAVGEVVTEPEFQSLIQDQVVQVYADSGARDSALGTAVADGMVAYLTSTDVLEVYDGSDWVGVSGAGITGVTAGTGLTGGGTAGDVTLDADIVAIGTAIEITAAQMSDYGTGLVSQTNGAVTTAAVGSAVVRNISLATAAPGTADGMDGDVWLVYTP